MDKSKFFDVVRKELFGGKLTPSQVEGMERILNYRDEKYGHWNDDWLAYGLATVFHETAQTMQPIREYGSEAYLKSKKYYPWYGRGLIQITWESNYLKYGIKRPEDALRWDTALYVMFDGMEKGRFTGKALKHYFNDTTKDPVNARRIINGTDKAHLIAGYHTKFREALRKAYSAPQKPVEAPPAIPVAEPEENWLVRLLKALFKRS